MKSLFIAGNWKSNKTVSEAKEWLAQFKIQNSKVKISSGITLVLCVPFTALNILKEEIIASSLPLSLGAQDVSPFSDGAYTGEISGRMVKELADWVIIGHSERRKYFGETDEILEKKVGQAKASGLKIIYCVPDGETVIPEEVDVAAYEPVWAIGTGNPETPENANKVISQIKSKTRVSLVIYGGSVTPENVSQFTSQLAIDGVLPGGASLDAEKFWKLVVATAS